MGKKQKKKQDPTVWFFWIVFIVAIRLAKAFVRQEDTRFFAVAPLLLMIAVAAFVMKTVREAKIKKQNTASPSAPVRRASTQPTIKLHSDAKPQRDFSAPEAYCLVCENTGEDHLAFDRAQRLRQLDDWMKNGLIDRAEYRALKETFEKNG